MASKRNVVLRSPWRFEMVIGPQHTGNSNYGFCTFADYLFDTIILVKFDIYNLFFLWPIPTLAMDSFC
jgi:hypothetical protein